MMVLLEGDEDVLDVHLSFGDFRGGRIIHKITIYKQVYQYVLPFNNYFRQIKGPPNSLWPPYIPERSKFTLWLRKSAKILG